MKNTTPRPFEKYAAHLLRRTAKKCPQRIKDTPAVLFLPNFSSYLRRTVSLKL